jgi:hypothetical protein
MSSTLEARRGLLLHGVGGCLKDGLEGQHLAEDRGGLGKCQRRRGHQRAVGGGEHLMDAVAQLVGERHHVARLALVVEQHEGMG